MSEVIMPIVLDDTLQKTNKLIAAMARGNAPSTIDWGYMSGISHDGIFGDLYDYGDQFVDTWKDTVANKEYSYPWQYNHLGDVELSDGETLSGRPFLQCHYAHPFGIQFSHQRAFLSCPDGLSAGTYTIRFEKAWSKFKKLVWTFTTTADVPAGGKVSGFYNGADNESGYKVYTHSADGKTVIETLDPVEGEGGTELGTIGYVARNGNLNCMHEAFYGSSRWAKSAIRQYLNSDDGVGNWWVAQDQWDIAPNELTTKAGFLSGFSDSFKNTIKTVKVTTYKNTVTDDGSSDITYDKVFLPSLEQIYCSPQISGEGEYHEYWKRRSGALSPQSLYNAYPNMITYAIENHASPQGVALRSCFRSYGYCRFIVNSCGNVSVSYADDSYRFSPLVVI